MNERRVPIGVLAIVPMAISFGLYAFTTQEEVPDPTAAPDATATVEVRHAEATAFPDYGKPPSPRSRRRPRRRCPRRRGGGCRHGRSTTAPGCA
jgi:hypothetical protein